MKFTNMRFDPAGMTDGADIRVAQSAMDYLFRRIALDYLPYDKRADLGISAGELAVSVVGYGTTAPDDVDVEGLAQSVLLATVAAAVVAPAHIGSSMELLEAPQGTAADAPPCMSCGSRRGRPGVSTCARGAGARAGVARKRLSCVGRPSDAERPTTAATVLSPASA